MASDGVTSTGCSRRERFVASCHCDTLGHLSKGPMKQPENLPRTPLPAPRKGRNFLPKLAALAVLAFVFPFAMDAVFTPWAFFMGGHFHLNPKWAGWGRMHSKTSGDYAIYMTISPWFGRGHSLTDITGKGALCTQRGFNYRLSIAGSFEKGSGIDLQGRTATIYPIITTPNLRAITTRHWSSVAGGTTLTWCLTTKAPSTRPLILTAGSPKRITRIPTYRKECRSHCMKAAAQTLTRPARR